MSVLQQCTTIIPGGEVNLTLSWKDRPGLWITDSFQRLILDATTLCTVEVPEIEMTYTELTWVNDSEIDTKVPENSFFCTPTTLAYMALLLDIAQEEGSEILDASNCVANLFSLPVNDRYIRAELFYIDSDKEWAARAHLPSQHPFKSARVFSL